MRQYKIWTMALAAALTLGGVSAYADAATPATPPAGRAGGGELGAKLGLSPEQKASIKKILLAAREKAKAATDKEGKMAVYKEAFEKIKTDVLTAGQREKFDQLKPELEEKLKERKQAAN